MKSSFHDLFKWFLFGEIYDIGDTSFLAQLSQAEPATRITMKNHNTAMILIKGIFMFTINVFL